MNSSCSQAGTRWTLGLTDLGRQTLWATLLVLLASLLVPAFGVLCTLVCLQAVALAMGLALRPAVSLRCDLPDRLVAGREATVRLQVRNDSGRPAYDLACGLESLPQGFQVADGMRPIESLGPGQAVEWSCTVVSQRRGRHRLDGPVCRSAFPLNLVHVGRAFSCPQTLLVLPAFYDLDPQTLGSWIGLHSDGLQLLGGTGTYPEYMGNRPYVPGDPPRRIDARAWARLSVPAVREFQETGEPRMGLFLDTCPGHEGNAESAHDFEAAVSLCASVAHSMRRCCTIEWFAAGGEVHALAAPCQGERSDRVQEILAEVGPAESSAAETSAEAMAEQFAAVSEVVFVLLSWDTQRRQWVEWAQQAGCRTTILVVAREADPRGQADGMEVHWVRPSRTRDGQVHP